MNEKETLINERMCAYKFKICHKNSIKNEPLFKINLPVNIIGENLQYIFLLVQNYYLTPLNCLKDNYESDQILLCTSTSMKNVTSMGRYTFQIKNIVKN